MHEDEPGVPRRQRRKHLVADHLELGDLARMGATEAMVAVGAQRKPGLVGVHIRSTWTSSFRTLRFWAAVRRRASIFKFPAGSRTWACEIGRRQGGARAQAGMRGRDYWGRPSFRRPVAHGPRAPPARPWARSSGTAAEASDGEFRPPGRRGRPPDRALFASTGSVRWRWWFR